VTSRDASSAEGTSGEGETPFRSGVRATERPPGGPTGEESGGHGFEGDPRAVPLALDEPALSLLRFTDGIEDEPLASFWMAVASAVEGAPRVKAVERWIGWARPAKVPFDGAGAMARAAEGVLAVLDALAHHPERTAAAPTDVLPALARAMRAWARAREGDADPSLVVGGVLMSAEAVALGAPSPSAAERNLLSNALRRHLAKTPAHASSEALHALTRLDPDAPVLAPFAESLLDLLLLDGDLRGVFDRALASLASLPWWPNALRWGFEGSGRAALRAARLLSALASHPDEVGELPESAQRAVRELLPRALAHPRFSVWSRAARAAGRLAGVLPGVGPLLSALLDPSSPLAVRRRAHAALGCLSPSAPEGLRARRAALDGAQVEPWELAALAVALPDDPQWGASAQALTARGGPETWAQLAISLREVSARSAEHAAEAGPRIARIAQRIAQHRPGATEAEASDRAHALIARLGEEEPPGPWALLVHAAKLAAEAPSDPLVSAAVEEFVAHTEQALAGALKGVGVDHPRTAARAGVVLDEVLDLVVDGDVLVLAERITDEVARRSALEYAEALRQRLLRTVWTGLRRPTPATAPWRRWMLRAATALPRVEPHAAQDWERLAREQVLETLDRVADDPSMKSPALQRSVMTALSELSDSLRGTLGDGALLSVLTWLAVRVGELPAQARVRRSFEGAALESVDRLYATVERLSKNKRAETKDLGELGVLAGSRCRLGSLLQGLSTALAEVETRRAELHWSGLPKFDLAPLGKIADGLQRARERALEGLTLDERALGVGGEGLEERAQKLNRALTSTSLKFVDAARRAEIAEQYVADLTALSESIASACGAVAGPLVRAVLARALVAVRAQAAQISSARAESVRFIGRLKILGPLGSAAEGGMTSTWLAEGPAPGKRVVVKLLAWDRYEGGDAETTRRLFEGEMASLASVVHPNVVSLVDAGFVDEGAYIAVELIPGASLETILRTVGPLDLRFLKLILRDAARGLAHLHARGIIHRDVKPGNILVQLEGLDGPLTAESLAKAQFVRAVMIDLGIAAQVETDPTAATETSLVGTPGYIAPEVVRGLGMISPALDVYALGIVAFEAITGINPYLDGGIDLTAVLVRHGTMPLPTEQLPSHVREHPGLVALLDAACAMDPFDRPMTRDFLHRWISVLK
jgi:hypothetical protein